MRQRFYSKPGYEPKVYGYYQDAADGDVLSHYRQSRRFPAMANIFVEHPSERGQHGTLARRHVGQQLLKKLQPEDHLIVYSADRISVSLEDFLATLRYFYERGIHLHLCEFWGTPLDCWSTPGRMVLEAMTLSSEVSGLWQKPAVKKAQAAKPARRFHNGKPVPWFCEVIGENYLLLAPGAETLLEDVCRWRDEKGWSWSQISNRMQDDWTIAGRPPIAKYKGKAKEAIDAYCFFRGWCERGRCDLNEISPAQIKNEYKAKLFPQETGDVVQEESEGSSVDERDEGGRGGSALGGGVEGA
jgi:hypothetical protein